MRRTGREVAVEKVCVRARLVGEDDPPWVRVVETPDLRCDRRVTVERVHELVEHDGDESGLLADLDRVAGEEAWTEVLLGELELQPVHLGPPEAHPLRGEPRNAPLGDAQRNRRAHGKPHASRHRSSPQERVLAAVGRHLRRHACGSASRRFRDSYPSGAIVGL